MFSTLINAAAIVAADPNPEPKDVKAGPIGLAVFLVLIAATVLLCWSFYRQMKKVKAAEENGVYGTPTQTSGEPVTGTTTTEPTQEP